MSAPVLTFGRSSVSEAARRVRSGGLIVYPTDTVYGLGCDPMNAAAVERLFLAKKREAKPVPIMCDSLETAMRIVSLSPVAEQLARRHWPGALTIVAPMKASLPLLVHQGTRTVGVRVPDSELCVELVRLCGGALTGTSANISGRGPCRSAQEAARDLGREVYLILDGGRLEGAESTVVRVLDAGIEVLRQGAVRVSEKGGRP
jgi:L-threonylcarbamoyladenylate synthase